MITAKEAKELSKYECEDLSADILINDINKYIKSACKNKEIEMGYTVDGFKYTSETVEKAIKILKQNGYNVGICKIIANPNRPNYPTHIELNIRWW